MTTTSGERDGNMGDERQHETTNIDGVGGERDDGGGESATRGAKTGGRKGNRGDDRDGGSGGGTARFFLSKSPL